MCTGPALVRRRARLPEPDDGRVTSSGSVQPGHSTRALASATGIGDRGAQPADMPAHAVIVGCQRPRPIVAGTDTRLQALGRAAIGRFEPPAHTPVEVAGEPSLARSVRQRGGRLADLRFRMTDRTA